MQRRDFLRLASVGAAAPLILPSRVLGLEGSLAPSSRLQMGVIGLGSMGMGHMRNNLLNNPRIQVVALCDVDREHLATARTALETAYAAESGQSAYKGVFTTGDFRELLARKEVDAVLIAVPDHWHAIPLVAAVRAGKDVYAEKPLALTISEGQAIVRAVEQTGAVCQVGSQQRSSWEFRRCVELARGGYLGRVRRAVVGLGHSQLRNKSIPNANQTPPDGFDYEMWLGPAAWAPYSPERCHWNFRWIFDYSGGQLTDWIGHHYDIAAWAGGVSHTAPSGLRKASAQFLDGPFYNTAQVFAFEAHYADGYIVDVSSEHRMGVRIEGDEGWVWATRGAMEYSSPKLQSLQIPQAHSFATGAASHMDNFLDCVATRRSPVCPVQEAHRSATAAHLANALFRSGLSELDYDPVSEQITRGSDAARFLFRAYRGDWKL